MSAPKKKTKDMTDAPLPDAPEPAMQAPNPDAPTPAPAPEVKHRLVTPLQVRGNLGKSTEAIVRGEWMRARRIGWQGFDLDQDNRTLSLALPEEVQLVELSPEPVSDLVRLLRAAPKASVTTIDPRAHLHSLILETLKLLRFTEWGAALGVRLTVLVFPLDELSDLDDIARTVEALGPGVDWVIVRNARLQGRTRMFDGSGLEAELLGLGAVTLRLPLLLSDTRAHLRAKEVRLGRALSFSEALKNPEVGLDLTHRLVLEDWLRRLFGQYDALAAQFLPPAEAARLQGAHADEVAAAVPERTPFRRGAKVNLAAIE
jgi:hypothetical protein